MQTLHRVEPKLQLILLLKTPGAVMKTDMNQLQLNYCKTTAVQHECALEVLLLYQATSFNCNNSFHLPAWQTNSRPLHSNMLWD